ncbi:MAG: dTMP kinase [Burkholderiales bacterium]|nr:dTMP kinase [Burkholderiales bacterium]
MKRGKFITLEGIDGAGKSTQMEVLKSSLHLNGIEYILTREPGGTPLGEKLRALLLNESMSPETEALMMFASRAEHLREVILPALSTGKWVISDRFTDASFAYQGGGRGMDYSRLAVLEDWVQGGFQPDRTFLFDLPVEVARERLMRNESLDRFEQEREDFFLRVRNAYLERAGRFPERFVVLDSSRSPEEISKQIEESIATLCK